MRSSHSFLAVVLAGFAAQAQVPGYTFYDLGKISGFNGGDGRVVGPYQYDNGIHAFVWSVGGGLQLLGTLPGGTSSFVVSGAPNGAVFGVSNAADGYVHAFRWSPATGMVDLGAIFPGENNVRVIKANSAGQMVGTFGDFAYSHAFTWTPDGGGIDLNSYLYPLRPDLPVGAFPSAVSDQGEVVGTFWTSNNPFTYDGRAFYWKAGSDIIDLGAHDPSDPPLEDFPIPSSGAVDVDQGEVIGECGGDLLGQGGNGFGGRFAPDFAWTQATGLIDLGGLGWPTRDANPIRIHHGEIVGYGMTATGKYQAYRATITTGMTNIHRPEWIAAGWPQSGAIDVRNGQIAGYVTSASFDRAHAILWTDGGGWLDLHPCNWAYSFASGFGALDDSGAIVINGQDAQFNTLTGIYIPGGPPLMPPAITVTAAPGQCGTAVTYGDLGAFGACLQATPPSGTTFPAGTTTVQLTKQGLPAGSFTVTVQAPPPAISCPADIHVCSDAPVSFPPPVASGGCGQLSVACTPPSGATFSAGATTDVCTATDGAGEQASCSFQVVRDPPAFDGFLPPIDGIGGSFAAPVRTFKLGSTIPIKFRELCGGAAVLSGPAPIVTLIKWTDATDATAPIDATPTDAATDGDLARLTGDQWHFNLSTAQLSKGVWQLVVTLPGQNGAKRSVFVQLR